MAMMWWFDGPPGWGHVIMVVGTLLFWALILLVVVAAAFRLPRSGPHRPVHEPLADPEQVLAQRLARGDIDVAEYRARLDVLRGGPPSGPAGDPVTAGRSTLVVPPGGG